MLWLHDDGGNPARLFAVDTNGDRLATLRVEGVTKTDWEDMAAFRLDGRDYLLIADTGDNGGLRRTLQLHVHRGAVQARERPPEAGVVASRSAGPTARAIARRSRSTSATGRSC